MIKSICIVRLSALGDVLMMVPLVRTLQHAFPQAQISWVISRPALDLVEGLDRVELIELPKPKSIADYWRFYQSMKNRRYDVLLAPQASLRANLLYPLIKAKRKIGYDRLRAKDGHGWFINECISPGNDHTLESFLKFAKPLGIDDIQLRWDLPVGAEDYEWAKAQLPDKRPILVINPAASKAERSWPVERYIETIKRIQESWAVQVVLTGGPGAYDRQLADQILAEVAAIDLVGKTRPKQLLAVIGSADAVLCPDTGPSHMAAAMGTPVVALHAVTSAQVSGPYPFRHLAVDYYPQAVESVLKTSMDKVVWGTHAHGEETMSLVPVDQVVQRLASLFEARGCPTSHT